MIAFSKSAFRAAAAAGLLAAVAACSAGQASPAPTATSPTQVRQNVVYGHSAGGAPLTADVYSPTADATPYPVVIIVHGVFFTAGDKQSVSSYAWGLAAAGYLAVNVDYSLVTPQSRGYPEQVQEIQRAIQWSIAHARQFGGDPRRIALVGISAGGYLSAMAGLLDSDLPGRPVKAVVTLSAPLDLPALDQAFRARLAACGTQPSCPQVPKAPPLSAYYGPLFAFLGCNRGNCSAQLIQQASPSSHVTASAPAFLIFNSANEATPLSQAADMGQLLRATGVPEQVVIVPGSNSGQGYLATVSPAILKFLGQRLGMPQPRLVATSTPARATGTLDVLVACCALIAAGSLGGVLLAARRQTARGNRRLDPPLLMVAGTTVRLWWERRPHAGPPPSSARRRGVLVLAPVAAIALGALVTLALTRPGHHQPPSAPPGKAPPGTTALQAPAVNRMQAAAWIARQVLPGTVIGCDPDMCAVLKAAGVPAGSLFVVQPATPDPLDSAVVVATPAVRNQFGGRLATVYAPQLIASFGSGAERIDIRHVVPGGAAAFEASVASARRARIAAARQLLDNGHVQASAAARAALLAGNVDPRLLVTISALAHQMPLHLVSFGDSSPGVRSSVPLRGAEIGTAASSGLASMLAFLAAQRAPYRPSIYRQATSASGQPVVTMQFDAPAPMGLSGP